MTGLTIAGETIAILQGHDRLEEWLKGIIPKHYELEFVREYEDGRWTHYYQIHYRVKEHGIDYLIDSGTVDRMDEELARTRGGILKAIKKHAEHNPSDFVDLTEMKWDQPLLPIIIHIQGTWPEDHNWPESWADDLEKKLKDMGIE